MSVLDALSWALLVGGGLVSIVAGIGILRFPDLFSRMHAASMLDTLGAGCVILGLVLQQLDGGHWAIAFKLVLVFGLLAFTTTTAGHALAKSAIASGMRPTDAKGERIPEALDAPEVTSSRP